MMMPESFRSPELHPSPEVLSMTMPRRANARIEVAQHTDGRWMWASSWNEGFSGRGYGCSSKWGNFAPSRGAAIALAVSEIMRQTALAHDDCQLVRAWAESIQPAQGDLFGEAA